MLRKYTEEKDFHHPAEPVEKETAIRQSLELISSSIGQLEAPEEDLDDEAILQQMNQSRPDSMPSITRCSNEMIRELIKDHERITIQLTEKLNRCYDRLRDGKVASYLRSFIDQHRMMSWSLRRLLSH